MDRGYHVTFKGPNKPKDKQLILNKSGKHFHGCNSLKGFFGKAYFGTECEKSLDHNDINHHHCAKKKGLVVINPPVQTSNHLKEIKATLTCTHCHRIFFGPMCPSNNKSKVRMRVKQWKSEKKKVCAKLRKCSTCTTLECPSCKTYVNINRHHFYIQNP